MRSLLRGSGRELGWPEAHDPASLHTEVRAVLARFALGCLGVRADQDVRIRTDPAHRYAMAARAPLVVSRRGLRLRHSGPPAVSAGHRAHAGGPWAVGMALAL
jgi:hypothetical protein